MVRCPSTGREISTGIETDGIDRLPKVGTRMWCPLCGEEHFWTSRVVHRVCVPDHGVPPRSQ